MTLEERVNVLLDLLDDPSADDRGFIMQVLIAVVEQEREEIASMIYDTIWCEYDCRGEEHIRAAVIERSAP